MDNNEQIQEQINQTISAIEQLRDSLSLSGNELIMFQKAICELYSVILKVQNKLPGHRLTQGKVYNRKLGCWMDK